MAHVKMTATITGLLAAATLAGTVAVAHADTPAPPPESTDQIGVVTISEKSQDGKPVPNAVVALERISEADAPVSSDSSSPTEPDTSTEAPANSAAPSSPPPPQQSPSAAPNASSANEQTLAFPAGAKFLLITSNDPTALALPAGTYRLTPLGVIGNDKAPRPEPAEIDVTAGQKEDAVLTVDAATAPTPPTPTQGDSHE